VIKFKNKRNWCCRYAEFYFFCT